LTGLAAFFQGFEEVVQRVLLIGHGWSVAARAGVCLRWQFEGLGQRFIAYMVVAEKAAIRRWPWRCDGGKPCIRGMAHPGGDVSISYAAGTQQREQISLSSPI